MSENKKKRYVKNHTLIAEQFIGKVEHPYVVNHKNGKKKDNDVSNLEIVTVKENTIHAFENNLVDISKRSNVTNVDVVYNNEVYNFPSIESCVNHFPELGKTYIKHIMNEDQNFNLIKFEKVNKDSKYSPVNAYYNGELYCTFSSAKEAGLYFGKKGKDVSQSYHAIYPDKVNQYKLSFPNVTTIESKEITSPISFYK